jgi:hypothetical protein
MAKIRCFSDIQERKNDILKGLVRYPLQIASKGVPIFLYPKGIMKGPLDRVVPILNGMTQPKNERRKNKNYLCCSRNDTQ